MTIDPTKIKTAKKWAETVLHYDDSFTPETRRIAEVVAALPAHIIDTDQVREALTACRGMKDPHQVMAHIEQTLLPAPKPRTLAELIAQGNKPEDYLLMQCMVRGMESEGVILIADYAEAKVIYRAGGSHKVPHDEVIPLVDEPRMVWPAPEPDMSIVSPKIDTSTEHDDPVNMYPEPQPGDAWLIEVGGEQYKAVRNFSEAGCEWSADNDDGGFLFDDAEVDLIRRLTPEQPIKAVTTRRSSMTLRS